MSDLPILIVDANPDGDRADGMVFRIDGPLPSVRDPDGCMVDGKMLYRRPLRVGGRVTLATTCPTPTGCPRFTRQMCPHGGAHPFATATVVGVLQVIDQIGTEPATEGWLVTVADVEAHSRLE